MKKRLFLLGLISALMVGVIPPADFTNQAVTTSVKVEAATKKPSTASLAKSVKKAYGENYIPNVKMSKTEIKDTFLVSPNLYSSAYVEVPMISVHIDTLAIFKAKNESSKKKIVNKLKQYKKEQIDHTLQYPSNLLKLHASKIYTNGNYVCFIMLGQVNRSIEESGDESAIIKAYQKQNQIAVNAIKKAIKK